MAEHYSTIKIVKYRSLIMTFKVKLRAEKMFLKVEAYANLIV